MRELRTAGPTCLLACLVLFAGCQNPAEGKPEATVGEHTPGTHAPGTGAATYAIEPESSIGFVGSKVTGSHEGGFREFDGQIHLVDGTPESSHVRFEIDTTSLWADNERLTGHLKSADFFDVEQFPRASFESTAIERDGEAYRITGNLDLHGVEKSISFPATIDVADEMVRAQAEFSIKRFDFGIAYKGKADDLIRDEVVIQLDLVASPSPPAGADQG